MLSKTLYIFLSLKYTINDNAQQVYEQLLPFWLKPNLYTHQDYVIKKLKDLYAEHEINLNKHKTRNNDKDMEN